MATEAMVNSYSPYSQFKVGAAVECADGSVFMGSKVENAAFGATVCAESAAVATAITAGRSSFRRIAIISEANGYCFPCGSCRQLLNEFSPDLEVLSARADGRYVSYSLASLLPMPFSMDQAGKAP